MPPSRSTAGSPARNQPCSCGSGLKYKQCCGEAGAAVALRPKPLFALGPLTEAGAFLESFSPLRQAVGEADRQPVQNAKVDFASDRGDLVHEYRQYEPLMAHWRAVLPPDP